MHPMKLLSDDELGREKLFPFFKIQRPFEML